MSSTLVPMTSTLLWFNFWDDQKFTWL